MSWDSEIWAPCRLGEAFTLWDLGFERTTYLYAIKADRMGHKGDAMSVDRPEQLTKRHPYNVRLGAGPRPWSNCWTYEPKIKIEPPAWCWDMQDDYMFGLELKPKRNGARRKARLDYVKIHNGQPVYEMVIERTDGNERQCFDSIPTLDSYFAPIWPESVIESAKTVIEPLKTVCPTAGSGRSITFSLKKCRRVNGGRHTTCTM